MKCPPKVFCLTFGGTSIRHILFHHASILSTDCWLTLEVSIILRKAHIRGIRPQVSYNYHKAFDVVLVAYIVQ